MTDAIARRAQFHAIARTYVTESLGKKNFDAIPYADNITLRTLHCPSGADAPLTGKIALCAVWWAPLYQHIGHVGFRHSGNQATARLSRKCIMVAGQPHDHIYLLHDSRDQGSVVLLVVKITEQGCPVFPPTGES